MIVNGYEIKPEANLGVANLSRADLREANLRWANLGVANLSRADLREANLREADLHGADLREADLHGADLHGADLRWADLREADLREANLREADLREADLHGADLRWADLREADLREANLRDADITDAQLPHYSVVPESGSFIGWKKLTSGTIAKLQIPEKAQRCSTLVGRKCRASAVKVLSGEGFSPTCGKDKQLVYKKGCTVVADSFDPDPRVGCTHGIHFFLTKREAEEW